MSAPLTDAINFLTSKINETTGSDDITLSAAIDTVCEGYGGGSSPSEGSFNALKYLTQITGLLKEKTIEADTLTLDFEGAKITNMYQSFYDTSGVRKLVIKNIDYPDGAGVSCQEIFRNSSFKIIEFQNCVFRPANNNYPFMGAAVEEIIGEIDMTYRTTSLSLPSTIREIRLTPLTLASGEFSIQNCTLVSLDSLISIANGLGVTESGTYDVRRSNQLSVIQSTVGNVIEDLFIASDDGETTLEQYIQNKGWTIRNS